MSFLPPTLDEIPTIPAMVASMDQHVAGLAQVKLRLAVVLRRFMVAACVEGSAAAPQNLLVVGPTGGGKTWLLKHLLASVPVIWTDTSATEYSDVGYQGRDLTQMYLGLTAAHQRGEVNGKKVSVEQHRRYAERWGVVLFDEFDKIRVRDDSNPLARAAGDRQVGKVLQYELLKLVEGTDTRVKGSDTDAGYDMKTDGILYIAMGAFQGINDQIARHHSDGDRRDDFHELIEVEDLIEYGFIPELVGRFATIVALPPLKVGDLIRILDEQVLPRWKERAENDGLTLVVSDGAMHSIANEASKHALGARSLEPTLDAWTWRAWSEARAGDTIILGNLEANAKHARVAHEEAA